jgi:glycosyltransferase involved in cell wall biosynthesis
MSAKPPILIICHIFPPAFGIAGRRWAKFAKALARRGHVVHVIAAEPQAGHGNSPWIADIDHPGIIVHRLPWNYPPVVTRWPLKHFWEKVAYRIWLRVLPLLSTGNYFDMTIFWRKNLLEKAGELIRTHGIRNVLVTGAPFRLTVYGTELKRSHGVELACDLRDPWTWHREYGHSALSPRKMAQEMAFERQVIMESDHVLTPHLSMVDYLRKHYPDQAGKIVHLPHAIDPDELGEARPVQRGENTRLIYAGTLYGAKEAETYVEHLLAAFDNLKRSAPEVYSRTILDMYITGTEAAVHRQMVERSEHRARVVFHEPIPAREVHQRIAQADAVLIFIPSFNRDLLGTKFNETFYQRRPMIHVGRSGAVSEHILRNGLGTSIPVEQLAERLPGIIIGTTPLELNTSYDMSDQLLDHITDRLSTEVLHVGPQLSAAGQNAKQL